jgi:peptidoglycan/xylan/chitin deacetylase (PgdA/CDA1 family)
MVNAIIAERSPEAVRAVAEGGHEVLSHSYAMDVIPALLSDEEDRRNIVRCTRLLEEASGAPVKGWLSPRGTSSARTVELLAEHGYKWHGDVFDDDLPYVQTFDKHKIVAIPLSTDVNDMPFMKYGNAPDTMVKAFDESLNIALAINDRPALIDVTVHAHIFGRPRGAFYYEKIIEKAAGNAGVWIATRSQIADHMLSLKSLAS